MKDPEAMSGVYALLSSGSLTERHPEHPNNFFVSHHFKLGSLQVMEGLQDVYRAQEMVDRTAGLPFTTKTNEFLGVIDYIWCNAAVRIYQVLDYPSLKEEEFPPIPNSMWPSDHLALGVTIGLS